MSTIEANSVLFEDINQRVRKYLFNPFLRKCDITPQANRFHFEVASAILKAANIDAQKARDVLAAVLLLQRGLSMHDEIDNEKGRKRQLYVLTGDFGSGQYYYVLAHLGDADLLLVLCEAVVRINEAKMSLLDLPADTPADKQASYYRCIEGELLCALAQRYFGENAECWKSEIELLVQAYVLKKISGLREMRNVSRAQMHERLTEMLDSLGKVQANAVLAPISVLFEEYLRSVQQNFERHIPISKGNS